MNQAASDGGGSDLELEAGAAEAIASRHDLAAERLHEAGEHLLTVDGGLADPELMTILSLVVSTVGELALVNTFGAATMRAVEQHLLGTDSMVAATYDSIDPDWSDSVYPQLPPMTLHNPLPPGWKL